MNYYDGFAEGWHFITPRNLDEFRAALLLSHPKVILPLFGGDVFVDQQLRAEEAATIIDGRFTYGPLTFRNAPDLYQSTFRVRCARFQMGNIRIRPGVPEQRSGESLSSLDCIQINRGCDNVVLYNNSFTWASDENVDAWFNAKNFIIQDCIIAQGLRDPWRNGGHSMGGLFGDNSGNITIYRNLFAFNWGRNPRVRARGGVVDIVNNLVVWPGDHPMSVGSGAGVKVNIWNNYYIPGNKNIQPELKVRDYLVLVDPDCEVWVNGNVAPDIANFQQAKPHPDRRGSERSIVARKHPSPVPDDAMDGVDVYEYVLAHVGARLPLLDAVDERILAAVTNRAGRIIDHPDEFGGYLDLRAIIGPQMVRVE